MGEPAGRRDSATSTAASAALSPGPAADGRRGPLRRTPKRRAFIPTANQVQRAPVLRGPDEVGVEDDFHAKDTFDDKLFCLYMQWLQCTAVMYACEYF